MSELTVPAPRSQRRQNMRGMTQAQGRGRGAGGQRGGGQGRGQGRGMGTGQGMGMGATGTCICPKCGTKLAHSPGVPCLSQRCPDCGAALVREGAAHHQEILQRRSTQE